MSENKIIIRTPIWKTRSIGLAEYKLGDTTQVEIAYKTKDGTRLYPDTYVISKEKALTYPLQVVSNVKLRIIPIDELEKKEDIDEKADYYSRG